MHHAPAALCIYVIRGGDEAALIEQRKNICSKCGTVGQMRLHQRRSLGKQNHAANGVERGNIRHAHFLDAGTQSRGGLHAFAISLKHLRRDAIEEEVFRNADAHSFKPFRARGRIVGDRLVAGAVIPGIESGQCIEHEARVLDRASERAHMIQAEPERKGAISAHAAICRLKPDCATKRRGDSNGAASVAAHCHEAHACGDRGTGTAGRAPWHALGIERIPHRTIVGIVGCDAIGELMHAGLANHDGSGKLQLLSDGAVVFRHKIAIEERTRCGANSLRVKKILEGDWNAIERANVTLACTAGIGCRSLFERQFRCDCDEGVESRILFLDGF